MKTEATPKLSALVVTPLSQIGNTLVVTLDEVQLRGTAYYCDRDSKYA